jgi:hypothetical protein
MEWHGHRLGGNTSAGTRSTATPKEWKFVPVITEQTKTPRLFNNIDVPSAIQCTLAVTSNEGASTDWQVVDAHHVRLRAARLGSGAGRVYTIGIGCTDRSGNHSSAPVIVTVPHDHH